MKKLTVVLGLVFTAAMAQAAVLAGWDVAGVDVADGTGLDVSGAPYTFSSTTTEVAEVSAQLTLGAGVNPSTSANQYGFKIPATEATNTLAGAIANAHYLQFSLTVTAGHALNLESIEMNGGASATGCSNVVLMCSVDGFDPGQEIASAYPVNVTGGFDTDASGFGGPIELIGDAYSNLTGIVEFRLYGWNHISGVAVTTLRNLSGEDLVVYGAVVELPPADGPVLSMVTSNGITRVSAVFEGFNTTDYVFQHRTDLADSNGWNTVSAPFATNTTRQIMTTNNAGFYRVTAE